MKPDVSVASVFWSIVRSTPFVASRLDGRPSSSLDGCGWVPVALLFVGVVIYSVLGVPADILAVLWVMIASVSLLVIGPFAVVSVVVALLETVE